MEFSRNVQNGTWDKWLDFGSDLDHCLDLLDPCLAEVCALRVLWFTNGLLPLEIFKVPYLLYYSMVFDKTKKKE